MATEYTNNYALQSRYRFQGTLEMQTALHIGGGRVTQTNSDSPVVLTPEGVPFIPGSSFKGSLRSTIEKFVPLLGGDFFSCALIEVAKEERKEAKRQSKRLCSTVRQEDIVQDRQGKTSEQVEAIMVQARKDLCNTCKLFGSPFAASRVSIKDLYVPEKEGWNGVIQIRDGVAIDRDSEKARDRLKYDFEVVPASATFDLDIMLENGTPEDIQLLSAGLSEFMAGSAVIGGKRSRGLGACILKNLRVSILDLTEEGTRNERLRQYLLKRTFPVVEDGETFLNKQIELLFSQQSER